MPLSVLYPIVTTEISEGTGLTKSPQKRRSSLYFSAKIGEPVFLAVLWQFVLDVPLREASRETGLSITSVQAIFHKLRIYFCRLHVFDGFEHEPPHGQPPDPDMVAIENMYWSYYNSRMAQKRVSPLRHDLNTHHHYSESCWRLGYLWLLDFRTAEQIQRLMYSHLLEVIRACGPVGKEPDRSRGRIVRRRQAVRMLSWRRLYKQWDEEQLRESLQYNLELEATLLKRRRTAKRKNLRFR